MKFMKISKSKYYPRLNESAPQDGHEWYSVLYKYRNKTLQLFGQKSIEDRLGIESELTKDGAIQLRDFLNECLDIDKRCDQCYSIKSRMPSNFKGELVCEKCSTITLFD